MSAQFTLPRPERRARGAAILPLINVVFLLLMFIVLAGVVRSPDPFTLSPPQATEGQQADATDPEATLYVAQSGEIRFRGVTSEADAFVAIARLAAAGELDALTLRADANVPAPRIVKLVEALRLTGITQVQLQAERKP